MPGTTPSPGTLTFYVLRFTPHASIPRRALPPGDAAARRPGGSCRFQLFFQRHEVALDERAECVEHLAKLGESDLVALEETSP